MSKAPRAAGPEASPGLSYQNAPQERQQHPAPLSGSTHDAVSPLHPSVGHDPQLPAVGTVPSAATGLMGMMRRPSGDGIDVNGSPLKVSSLIRPA